MLIMWRPYVSVEDSVQTFDDSLLYRFGRLQITKLLLTFASRLDLYEYEFYTGEPFVEYYWNSGSPYLEDLLDYYRFSSSRWKLEGGEPTTILPKKIRLTLQQLPQLTAPWSEDQARYHRHAMLNLDWFWYKRFFRCEKEYMFRLSSFHPFSSLKEPTSLPFQQVSHFASPRENCET